MTWMIFFVPEEVSEDLMEDSRHNRKSQKGAGRMPELSGGGKNDKERGEK